MPGVGPGTEVRRWFVPAPGHRPTAMFHILDANRTVIAGRILETAKTVAEAGVSVPMVGSMVLGRLDDRAVAREPAADGERVLHVCGETVQSGG